MDAYTILGIPKGSSLEVIKTAYRKLARRHHPDMGGDAEAFMRVQSAYDYLTKIGDHVPLLVRRQQPTVSDVIRDAIRENLTMYGAVDWPEPFFGSERIPKGMPPKSSCFNHGKPIALGEILLKPGFKFKNSYLGPREMFIGDIETKYEIEPELLKTGCWITLETPFSDTHLKIRIPAGLKAGQRVRVRNQGYWIWKRQAIDRADLYVIVLEKK